jgi:hypothetical protein
VNERYLPVDLTHKPKHVPGPLKDVELLTVCSGVYGEYDRLDTLALRPHYYHTAIVISVTSDSVRTGCIHPAPEITNRYSHHSSDLLRFNPTNL